MIDRWWNPGLGRNPELDDFSEEVRTRIKDQAEDAAQRVRRIVMALSFLYAVVVAVIVVLAFLNLENSSYRWAISPLILSSCMFPIALRSFMERKHRREINRLLARERRQDIERVLPPAKSPLISTA